MRIAPAEVSAALASFRTMLQADGYDLAVVAAEPAGIVLRIDASADACADCLVPPSMMTIYVRDALKRLPDGAAVPIELIYPSAHG